MEQALGHVAYGLSLRRALEPHTDLEYVFLEVPPTAGARIPVLRNNWAMRASLEARQLLNKALREQPLDALFLHTQSVSLFAAPFMKRIPTLLSLDATPLNVDSIAGAYGHPVGNALVEQLKKLLYRRTFKHARQFTTWSDWAKQSLVADYGVDGSRVTVVHPGTNLTNFPAKERPAGMHDGPLKLLFVGGDYRRKGGDLLRNVVETKLDGACELHIVTSDALPNSDRVSVYNGVKPHSPELLRLYQECDVFVLPTRGDCLAVVLGEAMASSLPIITTRVGAHGEAVEDGESGFVIEMDDAAALADRLQRLAADRALVARMGARSRQIGESRFDMAKGAATIAQILRELGQQTGEPRTAAGRAINAGADAVDAMAERAS